MSPHRTPPRAEVKRNSPAPRYWRTYGVSLSPERRFASAESPPGEVVERACADLSVTERIRRFVLADEPFGIENVRLTQTLKIRRDVLW